MKINDQSSSININNKIYPFITLSNLATGWDGYWAAPLSQKVISRGYSLWLLITSATKTLPTVRPAANGSIDFTWMDEYPCRELSVWLYDRPDYYVEWIINNNLETEGICICEADVLEIVVDYFKIE